MFKFFIIYGELILVNLFLFVGVVGFGCGYVVWGISCLVGGV